MTLEEARANIGGLTVIHMRPAEGSGKPWKEIYGQILEVDETSILLLIEDVRPASGDKLTELFRVTAGDRYAEALRLLEPPRPSCRMK